MIVRILGEGQYDVANPDCPRLDELDAALVSAVEAGDEQSFRTALAALADEVRKVGAPVADDTFVSSELVVPFADASLVETQRLLADSAAADKE